jgi:DNA-binding transcriptional LysR family regulator
MAELKQLRVLRAVALAGSFSAAADRLDYTQPAVSRIVAALERELGAPLIDRATRPLGLTDAGAVLMRHADRIFEHLAGAENEIQAIAKLDSGTLRVGTFSSAGAAFVVEAVAALKRAHPGIQVTLVEDWPRALAASLGNGDLDVAVVFDFPQAGEDLGAGLELEHLLDDQLVLVLPAAHKLATAKRVRFADLAREDWLLPAFGPDSPSLRLIGRGCAAAGFEPCVVCRVNDCQMTQAMTAAGVGISMLPELMLHPVRDGVVVKPLANGAPIRRVSAARLPTRHRTPAAEKFIALLGHAARDHDQLRHRFSTRHTHG